MRQAFTWELAAEKYLDLYASLGAESRSDVGSGISPEDEAVLQCNPRTLRGA
jgi:hypothetical protein